MATDIVAGLRILRGIGGEKTFGANYATPVAEGAPAGVTTGIWQAVVEAVGVLLSGIFLVSLVWLGTPQMIAGRLTVGQLISFFGYALFMVCPIRTFFEVAQKWVQGLVQRARRSPSSTQNPPWHDAVLQSRLDGARTLRDAGLSGITGEPGPDVVVSAVPGAVARPSPTGSAATCPRTEPGLDGSGRRRT